MSAEEDKLKAYEVLYIWANKRCKEYREAFPSYSEEKCFDMAIEDAIAQVRWLKRNVR